MIQADNKNVLGYHTEYSTHTKVDALLWLSIMMNDEHYVEQKQLKDVH